MLTIVTLDTVLDCQVPLYAQSNDVVVCGTDVPYGCTLMYRYKASEGCSYSIYNAYGACIVDCKFSSVPDSSVRGGGFTIDDDMARIKFSHNAQLYKVVRVTVASIVSEARSIADLYKAFTTYNIDTEHHQDIINLYLDGRNIGYSKGAIYLSTENTGPASLFGGVWEPLVGVFPDSVFAWVNLGVCAVCGEFTCNQVLCGQ